MRTAITTMAVAVVGALLFAGAVQAAHHEGGEWITLFDGKTLDGWKISKENPESWLVKDGMLAAESGRSHIFYNGKVGNHNFKNFEFQADVKTTPGSNSGIYIHTEYQDSGWPEKGYEAQVNNTHKDKRKTGSLYNIKDNEETVAKDHEWFHYHIKVDGKRIVITIDGKRIIDYTEPENAERPDNMKGRFLSSGTIAFQAHDPKSKTYFKNIQIKLLGD